MMLLIWSGKGWKRNSEHDAKRCENRPKDDYLTLLTIHIARNSAEHKS